LFGRPSEANGPVDGYFHTRESPGHAFAELEGSLMTPTDSIISVPTLELEHSARLRSRRWLWWRDRLIELSLLACGILSVAVTVSIIVVLATETWRFFQQDEVRTAQFLLGTTWAPLSGGEKQFGVWALIAGTFVV